MPSPILWASDFEVDSTPLTSPKLSITANHLHAVVLYGYFLAGDCGDTQQQVGLTLLGEYQTETCCETYKQETTSNKAGITNYDNYYSSIIIVLKKPLG